MKWDENRFEAMSAEARASGSLDPATHLARLAVILPVIAVLGAGVAVGASAWLRSGTGSIAVSAVRAMAAPHTSTLATLSGVALALAPTVFACVIWWLDRDRSPKPEV